MCFYIIEKKLVLLRKQNIKEVKKLLNNSSIRKKVKKDKPIFCYF